MRWTVEMSAPAPRRWEMKDRRRSCGVNRHHQTSAALLERHHEQLGRFLLLLLTAPVVALRRRDLGVSGHALDGGGSGLPAQSSPAVGPRRRGGERRRPALYGCVPVCLVG